MKPSNYIGIAIRMILASLPFGIQAQGLHIRPGAGLVISGAPNLVFNNAGLINDGRFLAGSSTVIFTGDTAASKTFIGGDNPIAFYNVSVSRPFHDLQLNNDAAVTGSITLDSGNLQLNNYTLDLGTTGRITGERNSACITGTNGGIIKVTALLNAPRAVNPGNIGIEFSSDANLGWTTITRGHTRQTGPAGPTGILRYFDIDPEMTTNAAVSLRLYYLDGELAGKDKNALSIFSGAEGNNNWSLWGRDKADPENDWVVKNNTGPLHRFTLAIPDAGTKSNLTGTFRITVIPNPVSGAFRTSLFSDSEKDQVLNLYDQAGHILATKLVHCNAGLTGLYWNVAGLANGVYYLSSGNASAGAVKIIKQ